MLAALVLTSVARAEGAAPAALSEANVDREVLGVVTKSICQRKKSGYDVLASLATTEGAPQENPGVDVIALKEMLARSAGEPRLPSGIDCKGLKLVESSRIAAAFSPNSGEPDAIPPRWDRLRAMFPGVDGITSLSLPGYSKDKLGAVVYVSGTCGALCGAGFIWELRKVSGHWRIEKTIGLWVS